MTTPLLTEKEALKAFRAELKARYGVSLSASKRLIPQAYAGAAKSARQVLDAVLKFAADNGLAEPA